MRRRIANVVRLGVKELRGLRADPILLLLILYMFTFAVYSVATGAKLEVERAAVAVVDEDRSDLSQRIRDAIQEPYFKTPQDIQATDIDAAMDRARFVFVIEIPPNFESDVLSGKATSIQINVDATAMSLAGNGAIYLQSIVLREALRFMHRTEGIVDNVPINVVVRSKFNPNLKSEWFISVMQVINNITILSVILTGAAMIREREQGTIEHLLVMPVTPAEVMLSKIWANGLVIIVAALLSLWLVVNQLLQVPIAGSIWLFVAGAILYQFTVTSLGIFLATFTSSMAQYGLLVIPVLMVMNLLSGSITPLESMPDWLQRMMQLSPTTQFVAFSQAILYRGADFSIVWPQMTAMSMISLAFYFLALMRFRSAIVSMQ
jgi:ABC-2 type transport system permease protein